MYHFQSLGTPGGSREPPLCLVRGSINIDEFFHVRDIVRPGETVASSGFERRAGGKGANQAAAIARAGSAVILAGVIGSDGGWVVDQLGAAGVDVSLVLTTEKEPTGRAVIQLDARGENAIILHKGANYVAAPALDPPVLFATRRFTHVLLQNETPWEVTLGTLAHARAAGAITLFNPSPLPSPAQLRDFPWTQLDWLLVNENEAHDILYALPPPPGPALAPAPPPPALDGAPGAAVSAHALLVRLRAQPGMPLRLGLVCTLGPAGVVALFPGPVPAYVPAAPLYGGVRDTTGAGDCFAGYLAAGLMLMYTLFPRNRILGELEACALLRRCVLAAGISVERKGAMESQPTAREVDERQRALFRSTIGMPIERRDVMEGPSTAR